MEQYVAEDVCSVQDVMTAEQAAQYLQTTVHTVKRRAREGSLPAAKIGREWRFLRTELDAWLAAGGTRYEDAVTRGMDLELAERIRADSGRRIPLSDLAKRLGG